MSQSNAERVGQPNFAATPLWPVLAGGTGALLWVQTTFGAAAELLVGVPTLTHLAACTGAGVVLLAGLALRRAEVLLTLFPFAILVAVATMPTDVEHAALSAVRFLPWMATFVAYILTTSTWLSRPDEEAFGVARAPSGTPREPGPGPLAAIRIVTAAALLVVPAVTLVRRDFTAHFSAGAIPRLTFAHTALTFAWCLALYSFFVSPMLDAERHRRQAARQARTDAQMTTKARASRSAGWAIVVLAIVGCFIVLFLSSR